MTATVVILALFSGIAVLEYARLRSAYRALREDVAKLEKANGFLRQLSLDQSQVIRQRDARVEAYRQLLHDVDLIPALTHPKIWPCDEFNCKPHVLRSWRN